MDSWNSKCSRSFSKFPNEINETITTKSNVAIIYNDHFVRFTKLFLDHYCNGCIWRWHFVFGCLLHFVSMTCMAVFRLFFLLLLVDKSSYSIVSKRVTLRKNTFLFVNFAVLFPSALCMRFGACVYVCVWPINIFGKYISLVMYVNVFQLECQQ